MNRKRLFGTLLIVVQAAGLAGAAAAAADEPRPAKVRIALAGDSTVTDSSGWGRGFAARLGPEAVCLNLARSGRSSKSYLNEGHWTKLLEQKPDYILIQFGHNDQPGKGPERETDPRTTYRESMARYVAEARAAGARPILVTSLARRHFTPEGTIRSDLGPYAEAVKALAAEQHVPVIDLHARSIELLERLGPEASAEFDPEPRDTGTPPGKAAAAAAGPDRTHLSPRGSEVFGRLVAEELRKVEPGLAPVLK
jgi:lysophospholipase L1-like esterase